MNKYKLEKTDFSYFHMSHINLLYSVSHDLVFQNVVFIFDMLIPDHFALKIKCSTQLQGNYKWSMFYILL